ncbi:MAG: hypothetical protein M3Q23_11965, partial [Actinomycetota bacterium]|nr:hypothetical protein [Actinomycetota bacterium]
AGPPHAGPAQGGGVPPPPPPGALVAPTVAEAIPAAIRGPGAGRPGGRSRRPLLIGAAAIVLVAVAVVAILLLGGGGSGPQTTIAAGPNGTVHDSKATFRFSADSSDATFQCSLDSGSYDRCTSPATFQGLDDGRHSLQVRAVTGGKTDSTPASRTWRVDDTTPPDTRISDGPPAASNSITATFSFTSTEPGSNFDCAVDGGSFQSCTSPDTLSGLLDGKHTFAVRATDPSGNRDKTPAERSWTVSLPFPTADEKFLLQSVDPSIRPNCDRFTSDLSRPGAVGEIRCTDGSQTLTLIRFASTSDMNDLYDATLKFIGIKQGTGTGCPGDIPTATTWHHTAKPNLALGNLVCYHTQGDSWIDWTINSADIYAYGFRSDVDDQALYDWWAQNPLTL